MIIDFDRLRSDLIDYYGPAAMEMDFIMAGLVGVESASDEELIQIAYNAGIDVNDYVITRSL